MEKDEAAIAVKRKENTSAKSSVHSHSINLRRADTGRYGHFDEEAAEAMLKRGGYHRHQLRNG